MPSYAARFALAWLALLPGAGCGQGASDEPPRLQDAAGVDPLVLERGFDRLEQRNAGLDDLRTEVAIDWP